MSILFYFAFMFSLFSLLVHVFIDVHLSHLNKDYLLTYLLTFLQSLKQLLLNISVAVFQVFVAYFPERISTLLLRPARQISEVVVT